MSFSRRELKQNAKDVLKTSYFTLLLGGLLFSTVSIVTSMITKAIFVFVLISVVFIMPAIEVGYKKLLLEGKKDKINISLLFSVFTSSNYMNVVKVMFFRNLYIFLWSLLFVIPGIVKFYQYFFIPYLLAENMEMETHEAFSLTKEMTNNIKSNIFVLDLSFIGWYLLGALLLGVGLFFVVPYHAVTQTELFLKIKENH